MTASEWCSTEPSGSPHKARTNCSNWLVTQASIVQCPELCGRGASSLTSTSPDWDHEHLDRQHPDEIELFGDVAGDRLGAHRGLGADPRRGDRGVEDMIDVLVFDRRVGRPGAVAAARDDDRDLAGEVDKAFEDADRAAHLPPRLVRAGLGVKRDLTLAVIAHAHALQHRRIAEIVHRAGERGRVGDLAIGVVAMSIDRRKSFSRKRS